MKKIALSLLTILPFFSFAQSKNLLIDYGPLKTVYYQDGNSVSRQNFRSTIKQDNEAFKIYKRGRTLMVTGGVIAVPCIALLLVTIEKERRGNTSNYWQWLGSAGGSLIGMIIHYTGQSKTLKAVKIFNSRGKLSINFNGENGVGLALKF